MLTGIACTTAGWLVFSFHDACVKLLVADFAAPQVLFMRSLVILCVCLVVGRGRLLVRAWSSPVRWPLVMRGLVLVGAWLAYYTAARHLHARAQHFNGHQSFVGIEQVILYGCDW